MTADSITRLAVSIQRECARTTLGARDIAMASGMSAEEALTCLAHIFTSAADRLDGTPEPACNGGVDLEA